MLLNLFALLKTKGFVKTVLLIAVATFFGVTIMPAKAILIGQSVRSLADAPTLPTILGMLFGDFLGWIATPMIMGALLTFAFSKATWIPATYAQWLIPILSAVFGAAITSAIPYIAPQFLNATVYQVILMAVSGVIAWLSAQFSGVAVAYIGTAVSDRTLVVRSYVGGVPPMRQLAERALAINGLD